MSNIVKITKAKKKSKSHVGFLGLLLFVAIVCFLLLSPIFAIDEIEVIGNNVSTNKYIISASGILYGQNILSINKFDAINNINNIPIVDHSSIERIWPNKIAITIVEKNAIADVLFYGSKLIISGDGIVIDIITDDTETNLPTLDGITIKDVVLGRKVLCVEEEKIKKYLEVLKKLEENDMLKSVIDVWDKDGIFVSFDIGHVIYFGDTDNLQHKIDWLRGILIKEGNPAYIDLHDLNKVITKPVWGMLDSIKDKKQENVSDGMELTNSEE